MAAVRLIKKYPNRRLYDTQTSTYITLADVKQLVLDHEEFQVLDAKSGEDLTRPILLQIILEEEAGGMPMFSAQMLSQIIRFYGNAMQGMMGSYLEKNIQAFIDIQGKLSEQSKAFYETNKIGPEMWTQFVNMQSPMIQSMMSNYIEQSKNLFVQMQENMQNQARSMFTGFPGFPGEKKSPVARRDDRDRHDAAVAPRRSQAHRSVGGLRVSGLPEGTGRLRADPDAALG
jgi:polyhydroxyalkanoate synthesis repressor PhaR